MQIQAKIGGILYGRGGKPSSNYPDLEPGRGTRCRLLITSYVIFNSQQQSFGIATLWHPELFVCLIDV